ncbi:MAG: hypothetical protein JXR36_01285 [Bacteroidales bacterium]|nr:hypothetical protein [Bacteroidales bacterium]
MEKENVSNAIMNKFQFKIKNNTGATRKLAIVPSYLVFIKSEVEFSGNGDPASLKAAMDAIINNGKKDVVKSVDFVGETTAQENVVSADAIALLVDYLSQKLAFPTGTVSNKQIASTGALNAAGYAVDVILQDQTVQIDNKDFVMEAANPSKKIYDFLTYIKTNPCLLKEVTIISTDKSAFSTDMEVAILDPFKRNPEQLIDMNQFYSKYQIAEDRIDLRFDKGELELSDVLLWTMNVPDNAEMSIILRF